MDRGVGGILGQHPPVGQPASDQRFIRGIGLGCPVEAEVVVFAVGTNNCLTRSVAGWLGNAVFFSTWAALRGDWGEGFSVRLLKNLALGPYCQLLVGKCNLLRQKDL